jgi:hypothetical protein
LYLVNNHEHGIKFLLGFFQKINPPINPIITIAFATKAAITMNAGSVSKVVMMFSFNTTKMYQNQTF